MESTNSIPPRLRPKVTRTRKGNLVTFFKFIPGKVQTTVEERKWLCAEVNHDNPIQWEHQTHLQFELINRYNLSSSFFTKNMKIYLDSGRNFVKGRGHTDSLDDVGVLAIGSKINQYKAASGSDIPLCDLKKIVCDEIYDSMVRKKSVSNKVHPIGEKALSGLLKRKGVFSEAGDM